MSHNALTCGSVGQCRVSRFPLSRARARAYGVKLETLHNPTLGPPETIMDGTEVEW